jgi:hypothetical protein
MLVRDISVGTLDPPCEVRSYEEIKNAVNAVCGNPPSFGLGDGLGDVVGAGWLVESCERIEDCSAHSSPLLALLFEPFARSRLERFALVKLMIVGAHDV